MWLHIFSGWMYKKLYYIYSYLYYCGRKYGRNMCMDLYIYNKVDI